MYERWIRGLYTNTAVLLLKWLFRKRSVLLHIANIEDLGLGIDTLA